MKTDKKIKLPKDEIEIMKSYRRDYQIAETAFMQAAMMLKQNNDCFWNKIYEWYPECKNKRATYNYETGIIIYDPNSDRSKIENG